MFGQLPDFTGGFDFLRKLWGNGAGMAGGMMPGLQAMTPPMDLDELDKRIHDLKAVEGWLQLNTNLLRTSIQGLEVQRATLVALKTFGNALSPDAMQNAMENVARAANAPSDPPHSRSMPEASGFTPEAGAHAAPPEPEPAPAPQPAAEQATAFAGVSPDAALWWNLLQQQFGQIASNAAAASMAPFSGLSRFAPGGTSRPEPAAAPAAKKPAARKKAPARKAAGGTSAKAAPKASAPRK
jgi:hypothetical protein